MAHPSVDDAPPRPPAPGRPRLRGAARARPARAPRRHRGAAGGAAAGPAGPAARGPVPGRGAHRPPRGRARSRRPHRRAGAADLRAASRTRRPRPPGRASACHVARRPASAGPRAAQLAPTAHVRRRVPGPRRRGGGDAPHDDRGDRAGRSRLRVRRTRDGPPGRSTLRLGAHRHRGARPEGAGPQLRRPAPAPEPHRQDGDAGGLRERALRAAAARRDGPGQPALARDVRQQRPVRGRDRPRDRRREGGAGLEDHRGRQPLRDARPPHPLDEPRNRPPEGDRPERPHQGLRLVGPGSGGRREADRHHRDAVVARQGRGGRHAGRRDRRPGRARARLDRVRRHRAPAPGARRAGAGRVRGGLVRRGARLGVALAVAATALGALAPAAGAHATLEQTHPERGAVLETPPNEVTLAFDEPVEAAFGALRVFDDKGTQVKTGRRRRRGGKSSALAVSLPASLPQGAYTATYRVVSADGHPVSGGLTFQVGESAAPPRSVETLLQGTSAGPVSRAALGIARGLGYLAISIALGGVAFLAFCWRPAVRGETALAPAGAAFEARLARLVGLGVLLGIVAGAATVVLQAAVAGETSAWTALDPSVVREVLGTRTGLWLGVRFVAWVVLAAAPALLGGAACGRR